MSTLSGPEVAAAGLTDWTLLRDALHTRLPLPDYATGLRLVAAIGAAAEAADHHPDLDLRYRSLDVRLTSFDVGGVTRRDLRAARTISAIAAAEGVRPEPAAAVLAELALDTPEPGAVLPFWQAVLDAQEHRPPVGQPELRAPGLPVLWFQPSGDSEPRQRFHLDVWVAPEVLPRRVEAATAVGGRIVSDADAPAFVVLVDPDGNRVCLCTWQERSGEG